MESISTFKTGDKLRIKDNVPEGSWVWTHPGKPRVVLYPGDVIIADRVLEYSVFFSIIDSDGNQRSLVIPIKHLELCVTDNGEPHKCTCPIQQLMVVGCTCGGK